MSRLEFTKVTKREALARSGQKCEASGPLYGLNMDQRCYAPLAYGVEFDHFILASEGGDNSLNNCRAVCLKCHAWKTKNIDTPKAAKIKRQRDKHLGIFGSKKKIPSRPFNQQYVSNTKYLDEETP